MSCTKRGQTDLLRFGKKRETLNPWSGHGGRREASVFETLIPCWFWEASVLQSFPEPSSASTPHRTLHHLTKLYKRLHHHMCACASWLCAKKSQRTVFSFICRSFFLLNLFDVRWPNEIWWHIFQENVVKEDECQQLCGDQVTIFIAFDPSPIIALPCPSLMLFWIHWWLLSSSDVTRAMLASLSYSLV